MIINKIYLPLAKKMRRSGAFFSKLTTDAGLKVDVKVGREQDLILSAAERGVSAARWVGS